MSQKVALFLSNCVHHVKHYDRADALRDAGFLVKVVAYDWSYGVAADEYKVYDPTPVLLTRRGGIGFKRVFLDVPFNFIKIILKALKFESYDLIVANSIEMAAYSRIFRLKAGGRRIVDLADIHPLQHGSGVWASLVRLIERSIANSGVEYIVTSPWFYWNYLRGVLNVSPNTYLIENKIPHNDFDMWMGVAPRSYSSSSKSIIFNGIIRCNKSISILCEVAKIQKSINIIIAGDISRVDPEILATANSIDNVEVVGHYSAKKLVELYSRVDFVWASDLNKSFNSESLIPNRFYQGIAGGRPLLAVDGSATSKAIREFEIGCVFGNGSIKEIANSLNMYLTTLTLDEFITMQNNLKGLRTLAVRRKDLVNFFKNGEGIPVVDNASVADLMLVDSVSSPCK